MIARSGKERMHPRNRFRDGYDFSALMQSSPSLAAFVAPTMHGGLSINYAEPAAVKALNQALLRCVYGLQTWDVPPGLLCPPIPGRSDYIHHLADLLGEGAGAIPRGESVVVLDVGTGANCIYPLVGASEYGWRFVGSDIDAASVRWASDLVAANAAVAALIECRLQSSPTNCFRGLVKPGEHFAASMCNPPFYASAEEAAEGARRKRRNLGASKATNNVRNFGGRGGELWCDGGELAFVQRMIAESAALPHLCRWFTTLVSKSAHLPRLRHALREADAAEVETIEMAQGQKRSRILAWTFMESDERRALAPWQ